MAVEDLYNKACEAVERANYDYAVELFREVLRQQPDYPDARVALRGTERRRVQERGSQLGALALMPFRMIVTGLKAAFSKAKGKLEAYEDFLQDYPDSFWGLLGAGKAADSLGLDEQAAIILRDAQRQKPNNKTVLRLLANVLAERGESRDALNFLERLLSMDPQNRDLQKEVRDLQATGHMAHHKMDSTESFRDLIRDQDVADELEKSSRMEVSREDYGERVKKAFDQLKEDPENPAKVLQLARAYLDVDDMARARSLLKAKHKEMPENYEIRELLGTLQLRIYDQAIESARAAVKANPESSAAKKKLQQLKTKRQKFAVKEYRWRVEQHPTDAEARMELAKALMETGQQNQAISLFQELKLDPRLGMEAARMLGIAFTDKGQYDLAAEQFEMALEMHPQMDYEGKQLRYSQAEALEKMGDAEAALKIYKKIYSQDINFLDVSDKVEALSQQTAS
jgi:tetratricopeptide (TPR) repeat protein